MTKKPKSGTLSTIGSSDKRVPKEDNVLSKMKELLGKNRIRFLFHANKRMAERNVIDYEVRQALNNGHLNQARDRYSKENESWNYSVEGKTIDGRLLRIGVGFETIEKTGERLLIVTVIDPLKGE